MKSPKYRIIEKHGDTLIYRCQRKVLFWWVTMEQYDYSLGRFVKDFDYIDEAELFIKEDISHKNTIKLKWRVTKEIS
jgi:hypothetical protein